MIQITQVSVKIILRVKKENILLIYLLRIHFYSYVTTQIQQKNKIYFVRINEIFSNLKYIVRILVYIANKLDGVYDGHY